MRYVWLPFVLVLWSLSAFAAEVQLRDVCHVSGTVVRLGDIADVYDEDPKLAAKLVRTELCRAPFAGQRRTLTHRQIRDHLSRAGWNLVEHQLSGASQVVVHADENIRLATAALSSGRRLPSVAKQNAHRQIEKLLLASLHSQQGKQKQKVEFQLTEAQSRFVYENHGNLQLARPVPAESGSHRVELSAVSKPGTKLLLQIRVESPKAFVTVRRALPKGKIVTRDDVELTYVDRKPGRSSGVMSIDDILGKETTTRLAAGQALESRHVRRQILVRSGANVTVFARNAGIEIRTTAKARDTGARGDVIWVEAPNTRKKYSARIIDLDTVEVLAQGATVQRG